MSDSWFDGRSPGRPAARPPRRPSGAQGDQNHFSARWSAWIRRIVFERDRSTSESV